MKTINVALSSCVGQLTQVFQTDVFPKYFSKPFEGDDYSIKVTTKAGVTRIFTLSIHPHRDEAKLCYRLHYNLYLGEYEGHGDVLYRRCGKVEPIMSLAQAMLCVVHISGDFIKFSFEGITENSEG